MIAPEINYIYIDDYDNGILFFTWTESIDLDDDELTYSLKLWKTDMEEDHSIELDLIETSFETGFNSEYLELEFGTEQNYSWNITVTDGFDEVGSSTNSFFSSLSTISL